MWEGCYAAEGGDGAADLEVAFILNDSIEGLVPLLLNHQHRLFQVSNL